MSTRRLWLFLAVGLPVVAALAADLPSVDLAYHLRAGEDILRTGAIPTTDTYTFTAAGERWLDQNWGTQVVLALVFRIAGWTGLAILRAALVGIVFGSVLAACRRLGVGDRTAALTRPALRTDDSRPDLIRSGDPSAGLTSRATFG